jgi:predicted lipase
MYNFGSPRVGNAAFARAYNQSVPNSWRITNKLDVIPRVPRLMGYSHVGNSCSVMPDGTFEVNGMGDGWRTFYMCITSCSD